MLETGILTSMRKGQPEMNFKIELKNHLMFVNVVFGVQSTFFTVTVMDSAQDASSASYLTTTF